jgi:beta-phosphoglucomutase-like phosphatase (HAD superfamily)
MAGQQTPAAEVALDELVIGWRRAFRAARTALEAAPLSAPEHAQRVRRLTAEVASARDLLTEIARQQHRSRFLPLLVSPTEARHLLGLPPEISACVFNLDGVLIPSAALHVAAWLETFDEFITTRTERTRGRFAPFSPRLDYPAYLHGQPRLAGVRGFLESRGIRLPEGTANDAAGTETVNGLANRKTQALQRRLDVQGVSAFEGSRSYLELAHEAGLRCAVVSASTSAEQMLRRSGIAHLIDACVDGETIRRGDLRVKPEPDTLLAACAQLGVDAGHAAAFETTRIGVVASRRAGFDLIIGVDGATGADRRDALHTEGAKIVVGEVADILEQRLAA